MKPSWFLEGGIEGIREGFDSNRAFLKCFSEEHYTHSAKKALTNMIKHSIIYSTSATRAKN